MNDLNTIINSLESIRHECTDEYGNPNGGEFWYARELYPLLGYNQWKDFEYTINNVLNDFKVQGIPENQHFAYVSKLRNVRRVTPTGGEGYREYEQADYMLSRFACYAIAQRGSTPECAYARTYFLTKARQMELMEQNYQYINQLDTREMCAVTDKRFSGAMKSHGVSGAGIGRIKSKGDSALFGGNNTQDMKELLGCNKSQSLYDKLDPLAAHARALAAEITTKDIDDKYLEGEEEITPYHIDNNEYIRKALINKGIVPEELPSIQDSRKTQRYINKAEEELAENSNMSFSPIIFINQGE